LQLGDRPPARPITYLLWRIDCNNSESNIDALKSGGYFDVRGKLMVDDPMDYQKLPSFEAMGQ
jgi:hypothetical protein